MASMNLPHVQLPDYHAPFTKAHIDEDGGQILEMFGPSRWLEISAAQGLPIDSQTLARAYEGRNERLTNIVRFNFVNGTGWWFSFAPIARGEMNESWKSYQWQQFAMDNAPEDTAPRYVSHTVDEHSETLTRYSIGTEARNDFYKTPEGREEFTYNVQCMVSSGWITAKLLVGTAVIRSKLWQKEYIAEMGPRYINVLDAMNDEIRLFGALSKDDKGLYKIHNVVEKLLKPTGANVNMIVLADGSLNFLALSGNFETEAQRRGLAVMEKRLSLGGRSLENLGTMFPGITIYEDGIFSLENLTADQVNLFVRTAVIGRYFMIDGSDFGEHMDDYPANKVLSVAAASMDIDAYKTMTINTAIDKCLRFDDSGQLAQYLFDFANNVSSEVDKAGMRLVDPTLVDPYIFADENYRDCYPDESKNSASMYHVIEHWGDMHKSYFTVDQTLLHGEMAHKNLKKELKESDFINIEKLKSLRQRLYDVPDTRNESIEGLFFAISANGENRDVGTEAFEGYASLMLKASSKGAVKLPYVDKNLPRTFSNPPIKIGTKDEKIAAAVDLKNGALYVKHPRSNAKLYVWALEAEDDGGVNGVVIDKSTRMHPNADTTETVTIIKPSGKIKRALAEPNTVYAYVLAPINAFGSVIDEHGRAINAFSEGTLGENLPSLASRIGAGSVSGIVDSLPLFVSNLNIEMTSRLNELLDANSNLAYGIKPPRLVEAPSLPYGYGLVTGLAELASMYSSGETRGWCESELETAARGMESLEKYVSIMRRVYPECILFDSKYLPTFMLSKNQKLNEVNTFLASVWDHVKHPTWVRVPTLIDLGTRQQILGTVLGGKSEAVSEKAGRINIDISEILSDLGFIDEGETSHYENGTSSKGYVNTAELKRAMANVLRNGALDPKVKETLINSESRKAVVTRFHKSFGKAAAQLIDAKSKKHAGLAAVIATQVVALANGNEKERQNATLIVNGVVGLPLAERSGSVSSVQDGESLRKFITQLQKYSNIKRKGSDLDFDDSSSTSVDKEHGTETYTYINTRLAISEKVWHNMASLAEGEDPYVLGRIASHILRPSDPKNPNQPLGVTNIKAPKAKELVVMQHARGGSHNRLDDSIFANVSLLRAPSVDSEPEPHFAYGYTSSQPSENQHLTREMIEDPQGPFYTARDGTPLEAIQNIARKKWLFYRYQKVSAKGTNDFVRMAALALCLTKVTKASLKNLVKEKLPVPDCCYIIAQPFIRLRMSSGLWADGGPKTAALKYNHEDVSLQYNGTPKIWTMHYTIWLNCSIYDPTKFVLMQDIKFEGYRGGMDDTINDDPRNWSADTLDFESLASCFVFSCGANFSRDLARKVANPMSLYGKYDKKYLQYNFAPESKLFSPDAPQWPSFLYYNSIWNFSRMNAATNIDTTTFEALRASRGTTGLMPMCTHKIYDEVTRDLTKKILGSGHLDTLEPPFRSILDGKIEFNQSKLVSV